MTNRRRSVRAPSLSRKTRRKGVLPNMRWGSHRFPEGPNGRSRPTSNDIEALARTHDFPESFDLVRRLTFCWEWWRGNVQHGPRRPASEHRKFLNEIARRASALEEALTKAGSEVIKAIAIADEHQRAIGRDGLGRLVAPTGIFDPQKPKLDLNALRKSVHELSRLATVAARSLPASSAGPRGSPDLINLLADLARIYRSAFGNDAPRITKADKYSGKFFDFVVDVLGLPAFGVTKSNSALGQAINKARALVDRRDNRRKGES